MFMIKTHNIKCAIQIAVKTSIIRLFTCKRTSFLNVEEMKTLEILNT